MALERIILNIIPAGEMPVFHCSQYETGRPVIIDLVSSDDDAFLVGEGVSVELHCRKCDDTIVTMEPNEVDNNTVTFVTSEQLTACPGDNLCELVLYADTDPVQTLGTLNFILHVEPDPLAGGITSESEIANLTQQIEDIAQEVIGEDYYNKTEVDGLISGVQSQIPTKTSDLTNDSGYITSSDLTPYAKTADLATVATTGDYNDLLNKPTIPDAQIQSDWEQADNTKVDYIKNKPDIDAMIAAALLAVMPVGIESGSIALFDTEIAAPMVNVSCDITATGGNGTLDNPIPINGYTEANITANGDVITIAFGQTVYGGVLDVTRGKLSVTHEYITIPSSIITTAVRENNLWRITTSQAFYDVSNSYKKGVCNMFTFKTAYVDVNNNNNTIAFNNDFGLQLIFRNDSIATETDAISLVATLEFVYPLATPFDIDLTPEVILAVAGTNNVYSDTNGDTTVQYKDSIQHYIDTRI